MANETPTDRELEALKVLWDRGEVTVRDLADAMNEGAASRKDELAYTTVLSLLQVMEQKEFVGHRREGKAYVYLPKIPRQSTVRRLANTFLEKVFDGAVDEYLVHALESKRLSAAELDQLDAMLAQARERHHVDASLRDAKSKNANRSTKRSHKGEKP
jgi:BlaI family transcriptional regulator, penicillinase repressor